MASACEYKCDFLQIERTQRESTNYITIYLSSWENSIFIHLDQVHVNWYQTAANSLHFIFHECIDMMASFPLHLAPFSFRSIHAISNDNIKFVTTTTATTVLRLSHNSLFLFVFSCFVHLWENKASLCRYAVCGDCNILNIPHAVAWITQSST